MKSRKKNLNKEYSGYPRLIAALFSLVGLGISIYLTYIHYANSQSFCDLSETVSCDIVTTSIYSEVFGVPMSILGIGYFSVVLFMVLLRKTKAIFQPILLLTGFVLMPSFYLTGVEIFALDAFCPLCEASKALMLGIFLTSMVALGWKAKKTARMLAPVMIAGIAAAAVTFYAQTGVSTKEDYSSFIDSLNQQNVIYYKSVKCSNCRRQEKLFGGAYTKLNSVECHPEGVNPDPQLCLQKGIKKTPTFIMEKDDQELKRLEGLQQLDSIADWAEVPFEK
ncbi:MAG: vitamin K epoxide reductase family protein [Candidatus Levyibacteriota bacterium]